MTLKEYFDKNPHVTKAAFAKRIGLAFDVNLYRYINGTETPSTKTLLKIYDVTDGMVTPNDLILPRQT